MTLGGVFSWVARAGLWVLAGVGAMVLAIVVFLWALWRGDGAGGSVEQGARPAVEQGARPAVEQGAVAGQGGDTAGASCECRNGAWCQGPQGGIYCLTAEGKKRYRGK